MSATTETYKSKIRTYKITTSSIDIQFLKKIFVILSELNKKAAELEADSVTKQPEQTKKQLDDIKKLAFDLCKVQLLIYGSDGEFLSSYDTEILDSPTFPTSVNAVIFDNSLDFNYQVKRNPRHSVRVEFDFTKPLIFDFSFSPSEPTPNKSNIVIQGESDEWVEHTFVKLKSVIDEIRTNRGWLHQRNIYDVFIFLLIFPLAFWNLYKLDINFSNRLSSISPIFQTGLYIYAFACILIIFRVVFNYSRWVFPYLEFISSAKSKSSVHRIILVIVFLALLGNLITDFIKFLWSIVI